MISSMKLKLATLLDNLQEFLSRLTLAAILILQYLDGHSGQNGYRTCHIPRPLQIGLGVFYVLTVTVARSVGGPSSSDLCGICFYQDDHTWVQSLENPSWSAWPYAVIGSHEHVSVDYENGVSRSFGNHSRCFLLYLRLERNVLLAHVVAVNLDSSLLEQFVHYVSKIDDLERNLPFLGHRL